jgi:hypothetical protein
VKPICPSCAKEIPSEHVNVAHCPACNELITLGDMVTRADWGKAAEKAIPGVVESIENNVRSITARTRSIFGWFWLVFTAVHSFFMLGGCLRSAINGGASGWLPVPFLILFYAIFYAIGLMFTFGRYEVRIRRSEVTLFVGVGRIGKTWRIAHTPPMRVTLEFKGAKQNYKAKESLVVSNGTGQSFNFGPFLSDENKLRFGYLLSTHLKSAKAPGES